MYLTLFLVWAGTGVWFTLRFISTVPFPDPLVGRVVYVLLGAGAGIFWVYAVYHYSVILFTLIERRRRKSQSEAQAPSGNAEPPRVALLYTTADDFIEEAALTCVRQDYPRFHVFLLDDSRTEQAKSEVDRFHEQHPSATTVLRRADRRGFKAGNLNNFLSTMGQDFDFFAVSDSDGILPTHFLSTGIAYFDRYSSLGFVQANHYSVVQPSSSFARAFSDEAKIRWEYNNLPRNRFGLPLFLGHGAIVRSEACSAAGGFPEVVAEDLAFTVAMRRAGYFGLFAPDILCGEGFPLSLSHLIRRHGRLTMGDSQALRQFGLSFLTARGLKLAEKLDFFFHIHRRAVGALVLPFVLGVVLLQLLVEGSLAVGLDGTSPAHGIPRAWDMALFGVATFLAPLGRVLLEKRRSPLSALQHAARALALYTALAFETTLALAAYLIAGQAHFTVTGTRADAPAADLPAGLRARIARVNVGHPIAAVASSLVALLLLVYGALSLNLVLIGMAVATLSVQLLTRLGWEWWPGQGLLMASSIVMLAGILLGPLNVIGPHWQFVLALGSVVLVRT